MTSKTQVCNLALLHVGVGKQIANLDSETSTEAAACRIFYATCLDAVLRDFPWPFATKIQALGLVEEDPNDEWQYSYRLPTDCLMSRRILSGLRNDSRQTRVPFKFASDSSGLLIYTDMEDAELEYTKRMDSVELYAPDFVLAVSFRIAAYIAPSLTGGDPFKLGARALNMYMGEIEKAKANAGNEEQAEEPAESEFIRARE